MDVLIHLRCSLPAWPLRPSTALAPASLVIRCQHGMEAWNGGMEAWRGMQVIPQLKAH